MFKKFFNKNTDAPKPLLAPMHITVDRSVTINRLAFAFWGQDTLLELPDVKGDLTLHILAQGEVDLGEGQHIYRMYPDADTLLLQLTGPKVTDPATPYDDIVLWYYHNVLYPNTSEDWNKIQTSLTTATLSYADTTWHRTWFDGDCSVQKPVSYWETVYKTRFEKNAERIFETTMLYHRTLGDGETELLQVVMEEPDVGDRCVSYMIGRILNPQQISV